MKKKVLATVFVSTIALSMATGAYGASKLQEIKAYLNSGISIKANGSPAQLNDSNGKQILPITYQNTTYLPIRAVSDILGVAVHYDSKTETIQLGEKVDGTAIAKGFSDMYHTKDPGSTTYAGKNYKEVFFDNASSSNRSTSFMLYPKKQYQKLYLKVAAIDESIEDFVIKDSNNDIILKETVKIDPADGLITIEANIGGVDSLYIYGSAKKGGSVFIPLLESYYK